MRAARVTLTKSELMKPAVSIVLAVLLIALPITQVMAQAAQQVPLAPDTAKARPMRAQGTLAVPALTPVTALLWRPITEVPLVATPMPVPVDWPSKKEVLVSIVVVVAFVLLAAWACGDPACRTFSPQRSPPGFDIAKLAPGTGQGSS